MNNTGIDDDIAEFDTIEEAREGLAAFAHENRRLRQILDATARAGAGKGALVEVFMTRHGRNTHSIGVVVCRADADEVAFAASIREGLDALAATIGGIVNHESAEVTGVTAGGTTS